MIKIKIQVDATLTDVDVILTLASIPAKYRWPYWEKILAFSKSRNGVILWFLSLKQSQCCWIKYNICIYIYIYTEPLWQGLIYSTIRVSSTLILCPTDSRKHFDKWANGSQTPKGHYVLTLYVPSYCGGRWNVKINSHLLSFLGTEMAQYLWKIYDKTIP